MPARALVALLCLLAAAACEGGTPAPDKVKEFQIVELGNVLRYTEGKRRAAPAFSGELLGGGTFDSASLRGKVTVVNFWASWCGPCRREQPILQRLSTEYEPKGVRFVGIDTRRDQRAAAQAFIDEFEVTYPSLYDPKSRNAYRFGLYFMPATYVLDEQFRIAAFIAGGVPDEASLRSILDAETS